MIPPPAGREAHKRLLGHQYEEAWANENLDVFDETYSHDVVLDGLPTTDRSADIQKNDPAKC